MMYDDFPILNDEAYDFLKDKFDEALPYTRNTMVQKIFVLVSGCLSQIMGAKGDENREIKNALKNVELELNKIKQNLEESFNIYVETNQVKTLNIFALFKDLVEGVKLTIEWLKNEKKEYLKDLAFKTLNSFITAQQEIVSALNKCTIKIFRFM